MKHQLLDLTLYTSALCNLKCKYCYIAKNKYLNDIEDLIIRDCSIEYFSDFLNKLSKYYDYSKLRSISLWGGEPTIGLRRFIPIIVYLCSIYPSIDFVMFSSNYSREEWPDEFEELCYQLSKLDRKIGISAQASIDGPPEINDVNRGNVTEKIIKNYNKVVSCIEKYIKNSKLDFMISFKSTLLFTQIEELANDVEKIKQYYNFFIDTFNPRIEPRLTIDMSTITPPIPCDYTKNDGIIFAKFLEKSVDLQDAGYFGDLEIIQFGKSYRKRISKINFENAKEYFPFCGLGTKSIGLLPDYNITLCHREFGSFVSAYTKESSKYSNGITTDSLYQYEYPSPICFPLSCADKYLPIFQEDWYMKSPLSLANSFVPLIKMLAQLGQVNERYKDDKMALVGSKVLRQIFGGCTKDFKDIIGSFAAPYAGCCRLLLNGVDRILLRGTNYEY